MLYITVKTIIPCKMLLKVIWLTHCSTFMIISSNKIDSVICTKMNTDHGPVIFHNIFPRNFLRTLTENDDHCHFSREG